MDGNELDVLYKANGFEELSRGAADLLTGQSMPCVFMRKLLAKGAGRD